MSRIGLIHSTHLVMNAVHRVLAEGCPNCQIIHTLDETLLHDLKAGDHQRDRLVQKLHHMGNILALDGVDVIVVTCSSLSPYVNDIQPVLSVPVLKIDQPMIEYAVSHGSHIGVVATNPTTVGPTQLLINELSGKHKKKVLVQTVVVETAFNSLNGGDGEHHDQIVLEAIDKLLKDTELVIIAQISAARVMPKVNLGIRDKVLTSLDFLSEKVGSMI